MMKAITKLDERPLKDLVHERLSAKYPFQCENVNQAYKYETIATVVDHWFTYVGPDFATGDTSLEGMVAEMTKSVAKELTFYKE